jgi:tetratricopeptide (TPR) repeat protein
VFVTPFSMKDAITMIGDPEVEDELAQLVQVSLLQPPDPSGRYRFLEPVRQYARHRLLKSGNLDNARSQHTDWIVASSRSAAALEWTPRMREMYSWIFDRREEMLAAVDFAVETDRPDVIIALMASSGNALRIAGIGQRFMGPAEAAVRNPEATRNTEYTAACNRTSRMALQDDRWDDAIEILKPGISAAEANSDAVGLADAKFEMALAVSRGEPVPEVFDLLEEANALAATAGTPADGYKLYTHAMLLDFANRFSEVAAVAERARQWWEEHVGGPYWGYYQLMAGIREYEGDLESALALYERAGDLGEAESMYIHAAGAWEAAGIIAARLGERQRLDTVVERRRRIGELTGIPAFIPLDIRSALDSGNHRKVLDLAREWYSVRSAQKFVPSLVNQAGV